jgi:hypothetical protein
MVVKNDLLVQPKLFDEKIAFVQNYQLLKDLI